MHSLCVLLPTAALAAVTTHTTIDSAASASGFTQQMSSFGVDLFATANTPAAALQHAACVMDQYLDQDRDGVADDPNVVSALTALGAAMVMGETENDLEDAMDGGDEDDDGDDLHAGEQFCEESGFSKDECKSYDSSACECEWDDGACWYAGGACGADDDEVSFSGRALQGLWAAETAYGSASDPSFDASLEEVLHLITQHGYANAYPSDFGEYSGTTLANAVDAVIGDCEMSWECDEDGDCEDYSYGSWIPGSCTGGFHYSDTTCDYGCLITEGLYWGVTSLLGAQEERCNSIDDEWEPCTPALMRSDAPALSTLIDTMGITQLPDGNCDVTLAASPDADGAAGHRVGLCLVLAALFVLLATADALSNDLDGDGVEDVAPEGSCCINGYGIDFADSSCGSTLAEVTANCCWSPFVARYSIQPDGEDQSGFDCVSFISEEDCNALGALWSDDSFLAGQCQHSADATTDDNAAATDDNSYVPATTTNWGSGAGWCYSSLDREIGSATGDDCWALCEATYGASLVAVDWNGKSECYCQSACECLMDVGDSDGYLMTVDSITALPDECPASYYQDDGDDGSSWCGDRRDCNAPAAYSSLTVNDDNEPLYVQSTSFPAALRAGAETGVDLTRNMLGTASDTRIYLLEPNGADDVYSALIDDYCQFVGWDWSESGPSPRF